MVATRIPPTRRPDLLLRPFGDDGQHVVKDPRTGSYFNLPAQEAFLLAQLDGTQDVDAICVAFAAKFGEALTAQDLDDFVTVARGQGFLVSEASSKKDRPRAPRFAPLGL